MVAYDTWRSSKNACGASSEKALSAGAQRVRAPVWFCREGINGGGVGMAAVLVETVTGGNELRPPRGRFNY